MITYSLTDKQLRDFARQIIIGTLQMRAQGKVEITDDTYLSRNEAEQMLKTSRTTLARLAESGEIKRVKVGGSWKYEKGSIEDYLAKQPRKD